jgi:hypothetical protein
VEDIKRRQVGTSFGSPHPPNNPILTTTTVNKHPATTITNPYKHPPKLTMVSLAYLITLLSVLVAVSRADEVTGTKGAEVDAKWYGNYYSSYSYSNMVSWSGSTIYSLNPWVSSWGNMYSPCYGGAAFPFGYGRYFAKASEAEAHSVSRRATRLDAEHLFRRESSEPDTVSCLSDKGASELFSKSECSKYINPIHLAS